MGEYSKSIAAGVGLVALLSKDIFGFEIDNATVDGVVTGIMALLTWIAVYGVSNDA